jgi:hypothetical protein
MLKLKVGAALCAIAASCGLAAMPAHAGDYWDNGPVAGDSGYCDNSAPSVPTAGCSAGVTIYDDFTSRADREINTITYDTYLSGSAPIQAQFKFYDHDPIADPTQTLLDFIDPVTTSADAHGATLVTLTGIFILLPAGHYWLGIQNVFTDGSTSTFGETSRSRLLGAELGVDGDPNYRLSPDVGAAFTLQSNVPEPASWALMLMGFGLAGAGLRRSTSAAATLRRSPNRATMH